MASEAKILDPNQCSWPVLNGFLLALGAAAVATAVVALLGASAIVSAGIGLCVGLASFFAYSLFKPSLNNRQETLTAAEDSNSFSPLPI